MSKPLKTNNGLENAARIDSIIREVELLGEFINKDSTRAICGAQKAKIIRDLKELSKHVEGEDHVVSP